MKFPTLLIPLVLAGLGVEAPADADADAIDKLIASRSAELGVNASDLLTEEAAFNFGYTRGLSGGSYNEKMVLTDGDKPSAVILGAIDEGFAFGIEARSVTTPPPSAIVWAAFKAGTLKSGGLSKWMSTVDLSGSWRLGVAITVGSGGSSVVYPAGLPVQLQNTTELNGVTTHVILIDGIYVLVPAPADSPAALVPATQSIAKAAATKERKASTRKPASADGGQAKVAEPKAKSLRDAIVYVAEGGEDNQGPGPLQSDDEFALAVRAVCVEWGIPDKARTFVQKAAAHVPYYLNSYGPKTKEGESVAGRLAVTNPALWVIAAIRERKHYKNETTFDGRLARLTESTRQLVLNRGPDSERLTVKKDETETAEAAA